jgi:hypothetical protein
MALRDSQFGRFGTQAKQLLGITPDQEISPSTADNECARLLGVESPALSFGRNWAEWLTKRGYLPETDPTRIHWREVVFRELIETRSAEIELLTSNHLRCQPICAHEFIPSTDHKPLYGWFTRANFVALGPDGTLLSNVEFDRNGRATPTEWKPKSLGSVPMLWILDERGEILVGPEAFGHVKHPSIACGQPVWAAGEIGFLNGKVRVASLRTGHYLGPELVGYKRLLSPFVKRVFTAYDKTFLNGNGLIDFDMRDW